MKGRERDKIRRLIAARGSLIQPAAMGSARTATKAVDATPTASVRPIARLRICFTERGVPFSSSSATSRVTAVEIPPVAKVAASI